MDIKNRLYTLREEVQSYLFGDKLSLSLTGEYMRTTQASDVLASLASVDDVTVNGGVSVFPFKAFEVYVRAYYSCSSLSGGDGRTNVFVDGGIRYSLGKFDWELSGRNLTDRRVYAYSQFSRYDLYVYSFALRPLEVLLSVKYSF